MSKFFTIYRNRVGKPSQFIGYIVQDGRRAVHIKEKADAEAYANALDTIIRIDPDVVPPQLEP